jgi:transposase
MRSQCHSTEILHIVLNNATFRDRPEVLQYAATYRITFYFTPTSASWLNRIECHFAALAQWDQFPKLECISENIGQTNRTAG